MVLHRSEHLRSQVNSLLFSFSFFFHTANVTGTKSMEHRTFKGNALNMPFFLAVYQEERLPVSSHLSLRNTLLSLYPQNNIVCVY